MNEQAFEVPENAGIFTRYLKVERSNAHRDAKEYWYELSIENLELDCGCVHYQFDDEAQAREFVEKFTELLNTRELAK